MEIKVEGLARKELIAGDLLMPRGKDLGGLSVIDPGRVFRKVTLLRDGVKAGKEGQPFVSHQRHDVALALDGPEL